MSDLKAWVDKNMGLDVTTVVVDAPSDSHLVIVIDSLDRVSGVVESGGATEYRLVDVYRGRDVLYTMTCDSEAHSSPDDNGDELVDRAAYARII
jgi:hypothetical protein